MSALFLPALCIAVILAGLLARTNVYDAFVRGAEEGLATLIQIAPCLCAILSAAALWRETGLLTALTDGLKPVFAALRLPGGAAGVRHQRGERDRVFYRVALSGRGGRQTCASCRSRGAAGLCGGGAGGGAAGLKQEVKSG